MAEATPALEIRNLHKRYGDLEVLKGISLTARDGDVIVRLGHHGRLAGERVADQRELVGGAHQQRVEAVELVEAALQRGRQIIAVAQPPLDEAAGGFGVVVGVEVDAQRLELASHAVRVRQRAVVDEAEVLAGGERVRAVGRDGRLGRHPGVADQVRAAEPGEAVAFGHLVQGRVAGAAERSATRRRPSARLRAASASMS